MGYLTHLPLYISLFQLMVFATIFLDIALLNTLTVLSKTVFPISMHNSYSYFNHFYMCLILFCFSLSFQTWFLSSDSVGTCFYSLHRIHWAGCISQSTSWCLAGVIFRCSSAKKAKQNKTKKQEFCYSLGCSLMLWREGLHKTLQLAVLDTSIKVLPLLALIWGSFAVVTAVSRAQSISIIFFTSSLPIFCLVQFPWLYRALG